MTRGLRVRIFGLVCAHLLRSFAYLTCYVSTLARTAVALVRIRLKTACGPEDYQGRGTRVGLGKRACSYACQILLRVQHTVEHVHGCVQISDKRKLYTYSGKHNERKGEPVFVLDNGSRAKSGARRELTSGGPRRRLSLRCSLIALQWCSTTSNKRCPLVCFFTAVHCRCKRPKLGTKRHLVVLFTAHDVRPFRAMPAYQKQKKERNALKTTICSRKSVTWVTKPLSSSPYGYTRSISKFTPAGNLKLWDISVASEKPNEFLKTCRTYRL